MKILLIISIALNSMSAGYSQDSLKMKNDFPFALVAGGSKGIGYAIAEALAKRHFNLILIARHKDSLLAAEQKLESTYKIDVHILSNDLSFETSAKQISD